MYSSESIVKNTKNKGIAKLFDKFVKMQNEALLEDQNNIRHNRFKTDILKFGKVQNFDGIDKRKVRLA